LYYSLGKNHKASSLAEPAALSAPSRELFFCALEFVLDHQDHPLVRAEELDDLDLLRLRDLRSIFLPLSFNSFLAVGYSSDEWDITTSPALRSKTETCVSDYIRACIQKSYPDSLPWLKVTTDLNMKKSLDFLISIITPSTKAISLRKIFPFEFDVDGHHITIAGKVPISIMLEESDAAEIEHVNLNREASIIPIQGVASKTNPIVMVETNSLNSDIILGFMGLSLGTTEVLCGKIQPNKLLLAFSVQCSAHAPSKKRQCLNRTFHPSGKCHVHMYS